MRFTALAVTGTILAALAVTPARAGYVGFDSLASGTIVTNQFAAQGIIFTPSGSGLSSRVTNVALAEFTTAPFSNTQPNALFIADPPNDAVSFHFELGSQSACANSVNFRAGDGDAASETFRVQMFDCGGNEIYNNLFTTGSGNVGGVANIFFTGQIQMVHVSAVSGSGTLMDDIEFGQLEVCPTPEPGSAMLLGAGIVLVLLRHSQKRRQRLDPVP